jgi:hypothetical protein
VLLVNSSRREIERHLGLLLIELLPKLDLVLDGHAMSVHLKQAGENE